LDAVSVQLERKAFACPTCKESRQVLMGKFGPFLKCTNARCGESESIPAEALRGALTALGVLCDCGAALKIARSPVGGTFIGCSDYPAHRKALSWKDFVDQVATGKIKAGSMKADSEGS
jgi:ssDNA-binding Zn-finger/Zn-ribbon topoisomerase 1